MQDNERLRKQNTILVKNMSRLFLTAKKEIQMRNADIQRLTAELEALKGSSEQPHHHQQQQQQQAGRAPSQYSRYRSEQRERQ
jgi:hypothetical protein